MIPAIQASGVQTPVASPRSDCSSVLYDGEKPVFSADGWPLTLLEPESGDAPKPEEASSSGGGQEQLGQEVQKRVQEAQQRAQQRAQEAHTQTLIQT